MPVDRGGTTKRLKEGEQSVDEALSCERTRKLKRSEKKETSSIGVGEGKSQRPAVICKGQ